MNQHEIQQIPMDQLTYEQDRIDTGDIIALAKSIKDYGLRFPLLISKNGENKYKIVDGRRRFDACKKLGHLTIPCLEVPENLDKKELALILNTHRLNLNPVEMYIQAKAYIADTGKTDPSLIPIEKIKEVAEKLNQDVHQTCRILNIGRMDPHVVEEIGANRLALKYGLISLKINNAKILKGFIKYCEEERPSTNGAIEWINSAFSTGKEPWRDLSYADFDTEACEKCRNRGQRDKSLFEDAVEKKLGKNDQHAYCYDVGCFHRKQDAFVNTSLMEIKTKVGLHGIKYARDLKIWEMNRYQEISAIDPAKCKTCKTVVFGSQRGDNPEIYCPRECPNARVKRESTSAGTSKKAPSAGIKDPAKLTAKEKKALLEDRFGLATRKAMINQLLVINNNQKADFKPNQIPTDNIRVLFFVGLDAHHNPFMEMDASWDLRGKKKEEKERINSEIISKLDIDRVGKLCIGEAAKHLLTYDRAGITPLQIDKAIALLYGMHFWSSKNYERIIEHLSKKAKEMLKDLGVWKPSWYEGPK
jgi:ParB/RepB/Spo0J family partition protein